MAKGHGMIRISHNSGQWRISRVRSGTSPIDTAYPPTDVAYVAWFDDTGLAVTSKRSAFMTFTQARMKSRTNFSS